MATCLLGIAGVLVLTDFHSSTPQRFGDADVYFVDHVLHQSAQVISIDQQIGGNLHSPLPHTFARHQLVSRSRQLKKAQSFFQWSYIRPQQYTMLDGSSASPLESMVMCGELPAEQLQALTSNNSSDMDEQYISVIRELNISLIGAAIAEERVGSSQQARAFAQELADQARDELSQIDKAS